MSKRVVNWIKQHDLLHCDSDIMGLCPRVVFIGDEHNFEQRRNIIFQLYDTPKAKLVSQSNDIAIYAATFTSNSDEDHDKLPIVPVWDFEDSAYMHMTYPLYLSMHCIYVIVYSGEVERTAICDRVKSIISLTRKNSTWSRFLVVINESIDESNHGSFIESLNKYLRIKDKDLFSGAFLLHDENTKSCNSNSILKIRDIINKFIKAEIKNRERIPSTLASKLNEMVSNVKSSKKEFIIDARIEGKLREILYSTGYLLHETKANTGDELIVCNPHWVANGMNLIFNYVYNEQSDKDKKIGRLNLAELSKIFAAQTMLYSDLQQRFLLNLIVEHKLAIQIPKTDMYLFPMLLPEETEKECFSNDDFLRKHFKKEIPAIKYVMENCKIPFNFIAQFVVMQYTMIATSNTGEMLWRNGVYLKDEQEENIALIKVDETNQSVLIYLSDVGTDEFKSSINNKIIGTLNKNSLDYYAVPPGGTIHHIENVSHQGYKTEKPRIATRIAATVVFVSAAALLILSGAFQRFSQWVGDLVGDEDGAYAVMVISNATNGEYLHPGGIYGEYPSQVSPNNGEVPQLLDIQIIIPLVGIAVGVIVSVIVAVFAKPLSRFGDSIFSKFKKPD